MGGVCASDGRIDMSTVYTERYLYSYTRYLYRLSLTLRLWIVTVPWYCTSQPLTVRVQGDGLGIAYQRYRAWAGYGRIA